MLLGDTHDDPDGETRAVTGLLRKHVDAVILASVGTVTRTLSYRQDQGVPLVVIDRPVSADVDQVIAESVEPTARLVDKSAFTHRESCGCTQNQPSASIVRGTSPAWSPSGRRLAFITPADVVAVHNFDGSITRTGVPAAGADSDSRADLAWSPDGNSLSYEYSNHVWVMNTHRPYQPRQLSTGIGSEPSWSPDSSGIVYGGYDANVEPDLWMVNADGSHDADLTNTPSVEESRPDWSPDGSSLTYLSYSELQAGLFVATVSGGDAHLVAATGQFCCGAPDWSPDGTQIAYVADSGLATVNSDGSNLRLLTTTRHDFQPDWQVSLAQ